MLHNKYQGPRPSGFIQEDCFRFLLCKSMLKTVSKDGQEMPQSHTAGYPTAYLKNESKNNKSHMNSVTSRMGPL